MNKKRIGYSVVVGGLFCALLLISACQASPDQPDSSGQEPDSTGVIDTSASDTTQEEGNSGEDSSDAEAGTDPASVAQQEWQNSAHASSFVLSIDEVNNPCARCHAPKNWMPTLDDIPESCQACKFELEPPPPLIAESDWMHVGCVICHQVDKKGNVEAEVSWLEIPALDEYASVETPSELCLKCHDTENVAEHGQVLVGSGHAGMQCTECHSPHATTATCSTGDCHAGILSETDLIPGHDEDHEFVSCAACHDSAGWDVGPHPETGIWTTFSPWSYEMIVVEEDAILQNGTVPFLSHDLGLEVNCERCHYSGNPWGLTENVEAP